MDDLVRDIINEQGAWGARDSEVLRGAIDLDDAWTARLLASLVERSGGRVGFERNEVTGIAHRVTLLVFASEDGLTIETRTLATSP